jgi:hypothetical protein
MKCGWVLVLATLLWTTAAHADDFTHFLGAFDSSDSRDGMVARWPDSHDRLLRAVKDAALPVHSRLQALSLLTLWRESPRTRKAFRDMAAEDVGILRSAAGYRMARLYGSALTADELALALAATSCADRGERRIAIRALAWVAHRRAGAELERLTRDGDAETVALAVQARTARIKRFSRTSAPATPGAGGTTHPH